MDGQVKLGTDILFSHIFSLNTVCALSIYVLFHTADFGVSAKNDNTLQKRSTFIGTPYW